MKKAILVERVFLILFVFLIPSQLALHFWPWYSLVFGIRVDYLSPTIYLTDLLALFLVILWIYNDYSGFSNVIKKNRLTALFFLALVGANTFFSTLPAVSFLKWIKLSEVGLLALYFYHRDLPLAKKYICSALFLSMMFFSLIGIYQFLSGRTSGLFYLLGERSFNVGTPSIALVQVFGRDYLRPYSTFPHPNAMSGYLIASLIFLAVSGFFRKNLKIASGIFIVVTAATLTFSLSGFLSGAVVGTLFLFRKKTKIFINLIYDLLFATALGSLVLPFFSKGIFLHLFSLGPKVSQRIDLSFMSGKMISERFWIGEGLNTFIVNIPRFRGVFSYSWLLQPAHNIFLLVFSEVGIVGLLSLVFVFYKIISSLLLKKKYLFVLLYAFVLLTGVFDHYWLTIQQNLLLFSLLTGMSLR